MELTKIEKLEKIEDNIKTCQGRIWTFQTELSEHARGKKIMTIEVFGTESHLHQIEITQKCLAYWERVHLKHLKEYHSVKRMSECLRQIGEALTDKPKLSIIETAWLTEINSITKTK